ncbi:MAG: cellobiose phosphorylase [Elusimicrobiota bacterium]
MARSAGKTGPTAKYRLNDDGTFVIENYNLSRTFASFFPGIAGVDGIPMWAFYINRGQCISTFGVKNKNYSMLEFYAADKAYAFTQNQGFRTFVKLKRGGKTELYEPFQNNAANNRYRTVQRMLVRSYELILEEENADLGLKTTVKYFTIPGESYAALARTVEFENLKKSPLEFEVIDGLPRIIPFWISEYLLKAMSTLHQAWIHVPDFNKTGLPYYKVKVELSDTPEVTELAEGNFYFGVVKGPGKTEKAKVVIDPEIIFGPDTSFGYPFAFASKTAFNVSKEQIGDNRYPCAMSFFKTRLKPAGKTAFYSLFGHIGSQEKLSQLFKEAGNPEYFENKARRNRQVVEDITNQIRTKSAVKEFDLYCRQTYLDNVLRGGMPVSLPAGGGEIPYYVYWRKHGDLEREYNDFQVSPSYYSQGTANFRDVNQNRRCDVFFNPKVGDFNISRFYNLLQLDGYNPLVVEGTYFTVEDGLGAASGLVDDACREKLAAFISKPFEPGSLLLFIEENGIKLKVPKEELLRRVLGAAKRKDDALRYTEGFWTDHWTYNLDLLENYTAVFPEKEREILFEKKEFRYFDNDNVVLPRSEKYVDAGGGKIRQFGSTVEDKSKQELIKGRKSDQNIVRTEKGRGGVYKTTLMEKLVNLLVNKVASLDSEGIGIEAEANKPGWDDALNGLPGIFGSCTPETFETKRMALYVRERLKALGIGDDYGIAVHEELYAFFEGLSSLLSQVGSMSDFDFWDKATTLKETYRKETLYGVSGATKKIACARLIAFIDNAVRKLDRGIEKAFDSSAGIYHTYFAYTAEAYRDEKRRNHRGQECVSVSKFSKRPLPAFLEAQVRYIKTEPDKTRIRELHRSVKKSGLYDKTLGMYKVNASLKGEPYDIGRCTVFSPGWLENESIWLHMEYKYLLELLKAGLHKEFFEEFRKAGVCFLKPAVYGRSILENSSFIASSAFPDKNRWGRGFIARLSGSTAEFTEMWICMTSGRRPFGLDQAGRLTLEFKPAIPGDFFDRSGEFQFTFLGKIPVTYHNSKKIDTWAESFAVKKIDISWKNGGMETISGGRIAHKQAEKVRNQEAEKIDIYF